MGSDALDLDAIAEAVAKMTPGDEAPYLNSYYFSFDATGVPQIDAVLVAVARAGKAYHSTEGWTDDYFGGETEKDKIQRAANEAAEPLLALRNSADALIAAARERDDMARLFVSAEANLLLMRERDALRTRAESAERGAVAARAALDEIGYTGALPEGVYDALRARAEQAERERGEARAEVARILNAPDYESACDMGKLLDAAREENGRLRAALEAIDHPSNKCGHAEFARRALSGGPAEGRDA